MLNSMNTIVYDGPTSDLKDFLKSIKAEEIYFSELSDQHAVVDFDLIDVPEDKIDSFVNLCEKVHAVGSWKYQLVSESYLTLNVDKMIATNGKTLDTYELREDEVDYDDDGNECHQQQLFITTQALEENKRIYRDVCHDYYADNELLYLTDDQHEKVIFKHPAVMFADYEP